MGEDIREMVRGVMEEWSRLKEEILEAPEEVCGSRRLEKKKIEE